MYVAGKLPRKSERLIQVTHDALFKGIEMVRPGATFGDIGHAIQSYVEGNRMSLSVIFVVMVWAKCFTPHRMCCTTDVQARAGAGRGHVFHH